MRIFPFPSTENPTFSPLHNTNVDTETAILVHAHTLTPKKSLKTFNHQFLFIQISENYVYKYLNTPHAAPRCKKIIIEGVIKNKK